MPFRTLIFSVLTLIVFMQGHARADTFLVSVNGNDGNTCTSGTTPCRSIGGALSKASPNDSILCMGPLAEGSLNITKSIDIDCSAGPWALSNGYLNEDNASIRINIPVSSSDPARTVRIRGLTVNDSIGISRIQKGIDIEAASVVTLEDVAITGAGQQGIINRGAQTQLYVRNSSVRNCAGPGIVSAGAPGMTVLDNVSLEHNTYGLATASGNSVTVSRSVIVGNTTAGVEADGGALLIVDGSSISYNNVGVQSGSAIRLSNNNITFNATGVNGATGTYGNNRFAGNGSDGTALTPVGGSSTDLAQK